MASPYQPAVYQPSRGNPRGNPRPAPYDDTRDPRVGPRGLLTGAIPPNPLPRPNPNQQPRYDNTYSNIPMSEIRVDNRSDPLPRARPNSVSQPFDVLPNPTPNAQQRYDYNPNTPLIDSNYEYREYLEDPQQEQYYDGNPFQIAYSGGFGDPSTSVGVPPMGYGGGFGDPSTSVGLGAPAMGSFFDSFLGGGMGDLFRTGGEYILGQQNIDDIQNFGRERQEQFSQLADKAQTGSEFKPYTVTSGLANVGTNAAGGYNINLSPEQEALQQQLMGQAAGLFGQVGQDPAAQQAAIFEQIRATQRPEEERNRLATEERMLSQGRLGIQSNAYGGASPELLAQETARQEAMGRANLGARNQALAEQKQALIGGQGLLEAGYSPQDQALAMLQGSAVPAKFADVGRRTGVELGSQLQQSGLEGRMQSEDMANQLRLGQQRSLLDGIFGQQVSAKDKLRAAELGMGSIFEDSDGLMGWLAGLFD